MKPFLRILSRPVLASCLTALALTAGLYADALRLPLFSDDLLQIPWLESISWAQIWSGPSPYGYYRPLWYSMWRAWGWVAGGLRPGGLHFLNLAAHFAAAWLAGLLAAAWIRPNPDTRHPAPRALPSVAATGIFAIFPFARQAVAWPGAIYNPIVSAMAIAAILAYDRARSRRSAGWLTLALVLTVLGPLTYETGLMVAPAIVLLETVGFWRRRWSPRVHWWGLLPILTFGGTLAFWRLMRGTGVTSFGLTFNDLAKNISYVVQGVTYPTAPWGQSLTSLSTLEPIRALWVIALPTLALLLWVGLHRQPDACALGVGLIVLFALPPTVSMAADWFALAPRFLYTTAVGTAILWSVAATAAWEQVGRVTARYRSRTLEGAALIATLAVLTPAILFVRQGMHLYALAGQSIWAAAQAAQQAAQIAPGDGGGVPLLLVNLPSRITPRQRMYPLGFEGITPLPQRVTADGLVAVHTGLEEPVQAVASGLVAGEEPRTYSRTLWGPELGWEGLADRSRWAGTVYVARYAPDAIWLAEAGGSASESVSRTPMARFSDESSDQKISLLARSAVCDREGQISLAVTWESSTAIETDVTVFAHLLDSDGALLSQADGYPLLGMRPFWLWRAGERLRDVRNFTPVPPGEYTVRVGLWELASGTHWNTAKSGTGVVNVPVTCR